MRREAGHWRARALAYHRRHALEGGGAHRRRHQAMADAILATMSENEECTECGAGLSDPVSVKRGIGPNCYRKLQRASKAS